jgi:beta-galactosidase/beta-glucuronidase
MAVALLAVWVAAAAPLPALAQGSGNRLSLDGQWTLTLDKNDPATKRIAAAGNRTTGSVVVPGAWQAQGFGEETEREWHQYMGVASYERSVTVPNAMTAGGRSVWLMAENVHRSVKLLVGAARTQIDQHEGYLTRMETDITVHLSPGGEPLVVTLAVNSTKNDGHDGLRGTDDTLDFGFRGWGGINGHVWLESRAAAWLADPHVQFELNAPQYDSAKINVTVTVGTAKPAAAERLSLEVSYLDAQNRSVGNASSVQCTPPTCIGGLTTVQSPALWSPDSPALHTAVIILKGADGVVLDTRRVTFGLREITATGPHFKLNGVYLYLQGYGDDSVYPDTIAPPVDKSFYAKRLAFVKSLGFHFVSNSPGAACCRSSVSLVLISHMLLSPDRCVATHTSFPTSTSKLPRRWEFWCPLSSQ